MIVCDGASTAMAGIVPPCESHRICRRRSCLRLWSSMACPVAQLPASQSRLPLSCRGGNAGIVLGTIEATYLAWIDTRQTGIDAPVPFFEAAGVGLSNGVDFRGPGFVRLNFGCTRATLTKALKRMSRGPAVTALKPSAIKTAHRNNRYQKKRKEQHHVLYRKFHFFYGPGTKPGDGSAIRGFFNDDRGGFV